MTTTATIATALLALVAVGATAQDEVYLQVTTPGLQRVSLAAPPFAHRPGTDTAAAASFASTLKRDLDQTAVLALLPADRMALVVVDPRDANLTRQRWRAAGAQFLLEGTIAGAGGQFVCEARLWDLASGEVAYSRRLQSPAVLATTVAHTLANELVNLFTGRPGPFLSRIAFVSDRSGAKELWVMRWDGSEAQQLTSHRSIAIGPAWSPDGANLAFTSFLAGRPGLYVLKPTEGYMKPLWEGAGVNSSPSFSPDGRQLAFASGTDGNTDIFVASLDGGAPERLTSGRSIETHPPLPNYVSSPYPTAAGHRRSSSWTPRAPTCAG
jgi:TolB protein